MAGIVDDWIKTPVWMMEDLKMQCQYCGGTKLIKTSEGYRCRNAQCEGATKPMQAGVMCEDCQEEMEFKGLNSWGEPSYRCQSCGTTVKL